MTHRAHATPHRVRHAIATGALLTAGALVLASCASPGASASGASGPSIVATTTQVGDFTRELVGDTADVTQLINSGQSAHGFDPSAAQLVALAEADALVVNGAGLESWLDDAVAASGFDGVLIDASTGIELFGTDDHADEAHSDEAHSDEAHSDEAHSDEAHAEEHADHAEGEATDDHADHAE
ncbi:MAG TPA: metal ABC transporter substrate-binding protein, partial [Agromyces sp.]|nr:metal ABC transporter substrate-binding protein [Agromyces sp.]